MLSLQKFENSPENTLMKQNKIANISSSDSIADTKGYQLKNLLSSNNATLDDSNLVPDIFFEAGFNMDLLNVDSNQTSVTDNKNNMSLPSWDMPSISSSSSDVHLVSKPHF